MELFLSLSCGSVVKGLKTWIRANVFPVRDIFAENLARLVSSHSPLESKILETMGYWLLHTNEQLNIDQTTVRLVQDCVSLYKKKSICTLLKNLAAQHETKPQFDPIDILKSCHALIIQETQRVNTLSQKLDLWIRLWNQEQMMPIHKEMKDLSESSATATSEVVAANLTSEPTSGDVVTVNLSSAPTSEALSNMINTSSPDECD